ncbi:unnamed protein product [Brassica oleracea var. botrytis]
MEVDDITMHTGYKGGLETSRFLRSRVENGCGLTRRKKDPEFIKNISCLSLSFT